MGNQTYFVTDRELRLPLVQSQSTTQQRRMVDRLIQQQPFTLDQFNRFGNLIVKESANSNTPQFILQINHNHHREEIVDMIEKHYRSPLEQQQERPFSIKLETLIRDEYNLKGGVFVGKQNGIYRTFYITPFERFEDSNFKSILYNHYMSRLVSAQRHRNIHNLIDSFFLSSGQHRIERDMVSVIIKEQVSASLSEINYYRQTNNWPWTEMQLELLIYHSLCGLETLHSANISHNDIRSANIYYSVSKHAYVIGGFAYAVKHLSYDEGANQIFGVNYYLSPQAKKAKSEQISIRNIHAFKNDVYALGITLLTSLFLVTPANPQTLIESARANLKNSEGILRLLSLMVRPQEERPSARQLVELIINRGLGNYSSFNRQDALIESLRYKRISNESDAQTERRLIAQAYENLFRSESALHTNTELLHLYQVRNDRIQQANYHIKIAENSRDNEQSMHSYQQAAQLYKEIATNLLRQHRIDESIYYYNKAITACERQIGREYELAGLLRELSKAYAEKSSYDISKSFLTEALNLTERSKGLQSLEYADMLVEVAKIESEFQEYKLAQNYLKNAVKILENRENETNPNVCLVKAQVLETLGNNLRLKATANPQKQSHYRQKAEQCLQESLVLNSTFPNNNLKLASNHENLGHIYFDQKEFAKAKKSYETSLLLRKHITESSIEIGQNLIFIANCDKYMNEHNKAISNYNDALQIFRREVGNNHNQYTAVALGNLGLVYRDTGKQKQAHQYIQTAKGILRNLYGETSPDYIYFSRFG